MSVWVMDHLTTRRLRENYLEVVFIGSTVNTVNKRLGKPVKEGKQDRPHVNSCTRTKV